MLPSTSGIRVSARTGRRPTDPAALARKLLWLYFFLLIFEGALRKWAFPGLSRPLLLIRDPVVLLIYLSALNRKLFPQTAFLTAWSALTFSSALLLLFQWMTLDVPLTVLVYGLRTNYLHLPLIFLIPKILRLQDLHRLCKWILWISLPMALLMAYQFKSPPGAWINRTAGLGEAQQLVSALGRIRTPGTFSFITGAVSYFSLATACLAFALTDGRKLFSTWFVVGVAAAIGLATVVSGSRSMILYVGLVLVGWGFGLAVARQITGGLARVVLLVAGAVVLVMQMGETEVFQEGLTVLNSRFETASGTERVSGGIWGRFIESLTDPIVSIGSASMFGSGLGVGTNVGATMIQGQAGFLLSEGEWGRVIAEMGIILGVGFIVFRISLVIWLGRRSASCAKAGNVWPIILWFACAASIINGQIAQPTNLGFMVFVAGLCLASIELLPLSNNRSGSTPVRISASPTKSRIRGPRC
jgi:hypothetical protein